MSFDLSKMGETKVTVPLILIAAVALFSFRAKDFTIGGLDEFFFSEAQGEELKQAVEANTAVLTSYIQRQDLRDVNEQLQGIRQQITETQLWIAANGVNPIATARVEDLVSRQTSLQNKKACLLNDNISDKEVCEDA